MSDEISDALAAAVAKLGGKTRPGQVEMAKACAQALASGTHLLVQAGTGTGKTLGYLIPALCYLGNDPAAKSTKVRVIVSTATLALQTQLADYDIPLAVAAAGKVLRKAIRVAVLKGRSNYICLHRVYSSGVAEQDQLISADFLSGKKPKSSGFDSVSGGESNAVSQSQLGIEVLRLREWAEEQVESHGSADKDIAPPHSPRAWAQVSISARECLGKQICPYSEECFSERARDAARSADLVVTNHALVAIDAMNGHTALPDHDIVIIDEAHELSARITSAAAQTLSANILERIIRQVAAFLGEELVAELRDGADIFRKEIEKLSLGELTTESWDSAVEIKVSIQQLSSLVRRGLSALDLTDAVPEEKQAKAVLEELFEILERIRRNDFSDVIWISGKDDGEKSLEVAPLSVASLLRNEIFAKNTVILTSATLKVGGDFKNIANSLGLYSGEEKAAAKKDDSSFQECLESEKKSADFQGNLSWRAIDVGSPFNYRKQGICYIAKHLPRPMRDGVAEPVLAEILELVKAAPGRTLGLFSSLKAAQTAAKFVRRQLSGQLVLCQGDNQLAELVKSFSASAETSLFGTLSLWQGIDVPGRNCELVIIDKIPFPRPDDPLFLARQRAVSKSGGNGFMQVAAGHAALLLAQGSGRLIRRISDRGVVAILDPRLLTASYGTFLRNSMPDFWQTTDLQVACAALQRLSQS